MDVIGLHAARAGAPPGPGWPSDDRNRVKRFAVGKIQILPDACAASLRQRYINPRPAPNASHRQSTPA
jgi:hypothetical protein